MRLEPTVPASAGEPPAAPRPTPLHEITERPAEPGEVCSCGSAATLAFVFADGRPPVPYCGQA